MKTTIWHLTLKKMWTLLVELAVQKVVADKLWNSGRRVIWNWRESDKLRYGWLWLIICSEAEVAGTCLRCVHVHYVYSYGACFSWVKFSVFTYYCSDTMAHNKCKIYIILKLFPNISNVRMNTHFQNKHDIRTDGPYSQTTTFWKMFWLRRLTKPVLLFNFLFILKLLPRKSHSFLVRLKPLNII